MNWMSSAGFCQRMVRERVSVRWVYGTHLVDVKGFRDDGEGARVVPEARGGILHGDGNVESTTAVGGEDMARSADGIVLVLQ